MKRVKISRKNTAVFVVFIFLIFITKEHPPSQDHQKLIDSYYLQKINIVKEKVNLLRIAGQKKMGIAVLKNVFFQARIAYKKLAVLTDYFNPYETKSFNGPAIDRIESEIADRIILPAGFQAIEQLLFSNWSDNAYSTLNSLLIDMFKIIAKLENEPDRRYKFKDELVWDAIRSAIVQITTTGITGSDSQLASYSLPEAIATIAGIKGLLVFFKSEIDKKNSHTFLQLISLLNKATEYLQRNNSFNAFDRLHFITQYINPFYKLLVQTRIKTGIGIPEGRNSINFQATSIFAPDALNINFYSPPPEYWVTPEKVKLGKLLFFDPILSGPHTRSCASCHQPEKAFTDGLAKPYALDNVTLLPRNTPTLLNSGFQTKQFYDSRADILENQLGEVVHNEAEMKGSLKKSVAELKNIPQYKQLFSDAYPAEKEPINTFTIANAISSYVRSLHSLNSRFDAYMRGDYNKLSAKEKNGFNLFAGKAKCATCHFIPLFNGLVPPFFSETESEVLGVPKTKNKNPSILDDDLGKYLFTRSVIHKHSFKTPTLRNIALTAPYMHNGVYDTLEEVMEFYNNGGGKGLQIAPSNQTLPFDKLNLSEKEVSDIIAFMKALTDTSARQYQ